MSNNFGLETNHQYGLDNDNTMSWSLLWERRNFTKINCLEIVRISISVIRSKDHQIYHLLFLPITHTSFSHQSSEIVFISSVVVLLQ